MQSLCSIYGSSVFNDALMRERLPKGTYKLLKKTIDEGIAVFFSNMMHIWPPGAPPVAWMRCGLGRSVSLRLGPVKARESFGLRAVSELA